MLSLFSQFDSEIPPLTQDGIFGPGTRTAVEAFQRKYGLPITGIVDEATWNLMYRLLKNTYNVVIFDGKDLGIQTEPYPGVTLQIGSTGPSVTTLQEYINVIASVNENVDPVNVTGVFGRATRLAVLTLQGLNGILRTGVVNEATWDAIVNSYKNAVSATNPSYTQHPGYTLKENNTDYEG